MKVCIFVSSIDKSGGGPSRSVPILSKGLSLVGVDTTLLTGRSEEMNTHMLEETNVSVKIVSKNISTKELEEEILKGNYDLIHAQNLWMPFYHKMANIARKHDIPYIMTPRGCLEPWCMKQKRIKKLVAFHLYQKRDLQQAACILATAKMEADNIRALGITAPIAIIPNGIDISEYECRTLEDKMRVKKQILFLSRIHEKKGIEFLINVWEQLHIQYPDWNVVIAGNGEETYIQNLKAMIVSKGLQKCVEIIPPVFGEEKHKLYCESSLFVLPTYSENFGMVIAEAMSCGVPVITTNGTPWQELNEKHIGWCIDLSIENLANTISEAIDKGQDKLFELGQQCSKHIRDTYQYTEVAAKNKAVYEWIVNGGDKPEYVDVRQLGCRHVIIPITTYLGNLIVLKNQMNMNTNIEIESLYPFYPPKYPKGLNEDQILAEMCAGDGEWCNIDSHFYFPTNMRDVAFYFAEIDEVDFDKNMEYISYKHEDYLTTQQLRESLFEKNVIILVSRSYPNYPSYDFYGVYELQRIPTAPGTNGAIDPYIPLIFILKETCYRL